MSTFTLTAIALATAWSLPVLFFAAVAYRAVREDRREQR